uniref:Tyrosine-protein kinase n=1 Tax=Amphimedon queenslandica TaxID=400682 RepID=A0A1X7V7J9_AMPQE
MSSTSRYACDPLEPGTQCCGRYNYPGLSVHELTFKKGDIMTIIEASKDPNWYKARRLDGEEGMIPISYVSISQSPPASAPPPLKPKATQVKQPTDLLDMPWYHGGLTRRDAEKLLINTKNGTFLVRDSANYTDDYTISLSYANNVEHYRVCKDKRGSVTIDKETHFKDLVTLIKHHQENADGLCTRLKFVLEKTSSGLKDEDKIVIIPEDELRVISVLGKGEFGDALCMGFYKETQVVIKLLESIKGAGPTQQFLNEVSIMMTLRHPNIIEIIGISLESQPICLVKEFVAKGSLEQFLRSRSRAVVTKSQLSFARDVCNGMAYLESKNIVHRNVTARHILLTDALTAKISKFWVTCKGKSCSVKWAAPETIKRNVFTIKSDVWSFGILLWEIYSCGRLPYPRIPTNEITEQIDKGHRMDPPEGCPDNIYRIMRQCWNADEIDRPAFHEIKKLLV